MRKLLLGVVTAYLIVTSFNVNSALGSRLDGAAIYDTDLNITWLSNANLAATESFGVTLNGGVPGAMSWSLTDDWIAGMNASNYLGFNGWRLPAPELGCFSLPDGYNCLDSEMGHIFYSELSGTAGESILTSNDPDLELISNLQPQLYWTGTQVSSDMAYLFLFDIGFQNVGSTAYAGFVWAVHDGDIGAVPIPSAVWLFGSGLLGLIGFARRKL